MEFTKEQKRIISSRPNGHALIKGSKGTGKTTAAVNKMLSLLNSYCNSKDDRILMVAYNEEASNNALSIYKNITEGKYFQSSFFDEDNIRKPEINTITNLTSYYFNKYKNRKNNIIGIASDVECENELKKAINTLAHKYKKLKIINTKNIDFIKDEIAWIKACNYLNLEEYQISNRGKRYNNSSYKSLRKNSKQRQAIYEILLEYNENLNKLNKIDIQDMNLLALKEASKNENKKYTHILIDDSQNLTKVQLEFLKALYNKKSYSSITFILESTASSCKEAWLSNTKGRTFASLNYDMRGKSIYLKVNHAKEVQMYSKDEKIEEDLITLSSRNTENRDILNDNSFALETVQYIDLKRNISHMFIKDTAAIGEIYIQDGSVEEKVEDVIEIPVFNEIAAGSPILMNDCMEDNYYLPKDWIRKSKDVFMLKIKGDSMVKKNINDGDYVVVNKQSTANIGDIVAVDIDGEATLKTLKIKYGKIALTPENDLYEPIIIEDQQFYILGVAIGVIKNQI